MSTEDSAISSQNDIFMIEKKIGDADFPLIFSAGLKRCFLTERNKFKKAFNSKILALPHSIFK